MSTESKPDMGTLAKFLTQRWDELEAGWFAAPDDLGPPEFPIDTTVDAVAYVLADIAAKRRIVEGHHDERAQLDAQGAGSDMRDIGYWEGLNQALRLLALPFVDHPDYQEVWRP